MNNLQLSEPRIKRAWRTIIANADRMKKIGASTSSKHEFLSSYLEFEGTPPSIMGRIIALLIAGFVIATIIWSFIGRIDVVTTMAGRVIPSGRIRTIQSQTDGMIVALAVTEGQRVRAGDTLVRLESTVASSEAISTKSQVMFLKAQRIRLESEVNDTNPHYIGSTLSNDVIALNESLRLARKIALQAKHTEALNLSDARKSILSAANVNLEKAANAFKSASEKEARVRDHIGTVVTKFDYIAIKAQVDQTKGELDAQKDYVADARKQLEAAQQRVAQIHTEDKSRVNSDLRDTVVQLASAESVLERANRAVDERIIRAPIDGTIQTLTVTTLGGYVNAGKSIATIVPLNESVVIEGILLNEEIGFVSEGQKVNIKVDTFPSQIYGDIEGKVIKISPDSESQSNVGSQAANGASGSATSSSFGYRVTIGLSKNHLLINGREAKIISGMSVQADIVTDKRRIIDFFIQPIGRAIEKDLSAR